MAINRSEFARDCVDQAMLFGVNPHYLIAVAEILSGIKDDSDGNRIGPFRVTQADWDARGSDPTFELTLQPAHISRPGMQCIFAALMTFRAQKGLLEQNQDRFPSPEDLYGVWPNLVPPDGKTPKDALDAALRNTESLLKPAVDAALDGMDANALIGGIRLDSIPSAKHEIARMIVKAFADAGFGKLQQAAALANAIAESNLSPNAHNQSGEDSVGLFQLNRTGGLGKGHSIDSLKDPAQNIQIIIDEARNVAAFGSANSLHEAVAIFVRKIERPADQGGEIVKRLAIAQKLLV